MSPKGTLAAVIAVALCLLVALGNGELSTSNATEDTEHEHRYHVVSFDWERVRIPFTVALWITFAIIAKIGFHFSQHIVNIFPDSALLIALGLLAGAALQLLGRVSGLPSFVRGISLEPVLFFTYLLPPIVLDAGYFMPGRAFFGNLSTILVFAVLATVWNVATIGVSLWGVSQWIGGFSVPTTLLDLLLFAAIVSAVDPVAVLVVFEEVHVNQLLYISVFGESLLNDAVTVVLYKMFNTFSLIGQENLLPVDIFSAFVSFFIVSLGGVLMGLIWAVITSVTTKYTEHLAVVQPLICLLFPYLAYLCATMFHISEILAIVFCGVFMKQYVNANISRESATTVQYFLKTLTSCCETIIFMFLGLSTVSTEHQFDWIFTLSTLVFCLVYRFIGILGLCAIVNHFRTQPLTAQDQFIMAYGGLRGAVSFGLAASLRDTIAAKHMFLTTAIVVILFTVFALGVTVKPLVNLLQVRRTSYRTLNMSEQIFYDLIDHIMAGVEEITGVHGLYFFHDLYQHYNSRYLRPWLTAEKAVNHSPSGQLLEKLEELNIEAAMAYLKEHGGFPTATGAPFPEQQLELTDEQRATFNGESDERKRKSSRGKLKSSVSFTFEDDDDDTGRDLESLRHFLKTSKSHRRNSNRRYSRTLLDTDVQAALRNRRSSSRAVSTPPVDESEEIARKSLGNRFVAMLRRPHTGTSSSTIDRERSVSVSTCGSRRSSIDETAFAAAMPSNQKDFVRIIGAPQRIKESNVAILPIYFLRREAAKVAPTLPPTPSKPSVEHPPMHGMHTRLTTSLTNIYEATPDELARETIEESYPLLLESRVNAASRVTDSKDTDIEQPPGENDEEETPVTVMDE